MVTGALSSNAPAFATSAASSLSGATTGDYSQNLDAQIDGFLEADESSDDDVGKDSLSLGLNNKDDPEANANSTNELIDLGGDSGNQSYRKAASNIPKLSGPN